MISFSVTDSDINIIATLLISFLEGGLLGLERYKVGLEHLEKGMEVEEIPGVRTYGLMSLLGSVVALILSSQLPLTPFSVEAITISSIIFVLILSSMYMYFRLFKLRITGLTSYLVFYSTFIVGFLTGYGFYVVSMSLTFLIAGILAFKKSITGIVQKLSYEEIMAGLELGMVVFILGPFAFGSKYSLFGLNLSGIYTFFTLILAISYISYLFYKAKGSKSLPIVAFLGGLINSEATLMNLIKLKISHREAVKLTAIDDAGMIIRTSIIVIVGALPFLPSNLYGEFFKDIVIGSSIALAILYLTYKLSGKNAKTSVEEETIKVITNPLDVRIAIRGALLYILIFIIVKLTSSYLSSYALYVASYLGGYANAGATVLSLLSLGTSISVKVISVGSLLSIAAAILNKVIYAIISTKDREIIKSVIIATVPASVALTVVSILLLVL